MAASQAVASQVTAEKAHSYLNQRNLWLMVGGFTFFNFFVRWYEEVYGWSAGLDAFAPEFKTYWMNWLYIETALYIPLFAAIGGYLWKTRTRDMDALTSTEVLTNHFHHLVW
ncbi:MAG: methane monooxygenase/ammonia monooxygenase subunit C, partial [Gammaproteobacteria bacterium]